MTTVITIDGPSGAGKGTISRLLAQKLGYHLLDSGALYRLSGLQCDSLGVDLADEGAVTACTEAMDIHFQVEGERTHVMLSGEDVSLAIRQERVGMLASKVAAYPMVRTALLEKQRQFAEAPGLVADGRDMGTVVFPQAQHKFFLTASAQERARRRLLQLGESEANEVLYKKVLADIEARDLNDSTRATAPLKAAHDAVQIDCTDLGIQEVLELVLSKLGK